MNTGELIKYYRKQRHMTQDELAARIGSTKQTISKYEHGIISDMKRSVLLAIARELNVDASVLLGLSLDEINEAERIRDAIKQRPKLGELLSHSMTLNDDNLNALIRIVKSMRE